jgi:hypothetical protein
MYDSITIISDCFDENARGRQIARYNSLFPKIPVQLIWVKSDIQAAGFLLDICDSFLDGNNLVVVNVAPRDGTSEKWENGTPFWYFMFDWHMILSSVDGYTLSLVKKLGLLKDFFLFDIPEVLEAAYENEEVGIEEKDYIAHTQFRSFEFLPRVAIWMAEESFEIPQKRYNISEIADIGNRVWHIDNFGNCKTTILSSEFKKETISDLRFQDLYFKKELRQLEAWEIAFVEGSSWFDLDRFIEIVKNSGDSWDSLNLYIGDEIK